MIIHRIAKNIRQQNWFTVFIEFVIVVVGIYVGLQVDDWNQARKDKLLEQEYLERLYDDLNGSLEDFLEYYQWDRNRLNNQYIVLTSLRAGKLEEQDKAAFASGLAMAGIHNPPRRRWGTVEELISTGNISLIDDLELRTAISETSGEYERNQEIYRESQARSAMLQASIRAHYDVVRFHWLWAGHAEVDYDFEALAADKNFLNTFSNLHTSSDLSFTFSLRPIRDIQTLRDTLAEKLGKDTTDAIRVEINMDDYPWRITPEEARAK